MTALTLTPVRRRDLQEAVKFDGTRDHANAIIEWIRAVHQHEVPHGHFRDGDRVIFYTVQSGLTIQCRPRSWIVHLRRTDFAVYRAEAFKLLFEVK